jgi:shikimate kinase
LNRIRALLEERKPFYRQADVLINTGMRSIKEVTQQVLIQFHFARTRGIASEKPS